MSKILSIIIPIYNAEKFLKETLNSIINQMNDDIELILVNDGSTDNSLEICEQFKKENSDNIIIKTISNSGSGIARNVGISIANGEYLFFPDSDDILCENALNYILDKVKEKPDYIVFSYYQGKRNSDFNTFEIVKIEDNEYKGNDLRKKYESCLIPSSNIYLQGAPWNKVFKKQIILQNKVEYPSLKRHQDDVFIHNYISYADKIITCSKPIYIYFMNSSFDESLKFPKNYFEIRKEVYFTFLNNLEKWESTEISKLYCGFTFLLALKRIFLLTYSDKWNLNKIEKDNCFKHVLYDETVENVVKNVTNNLDEILKIIPNLSLFKKVYYRIYMKLLKNKNIFLFKFASFVIYKIGNKL